MFYPLLVMWLCVLLLCVRPGDAEVSAERWAREFRVSEVDSGVRSDFTGSHDRLHGDLVSRAGGRARGHVLAVHAYGVLLEESGGAKAAQKRHEMLRELAEREGLHYKHVSNTAGMLTGDVREVSRALSLPFVEAVLPFTERAKVHRSLSCEGASEDEAVGLVFRTVPMSGAELSALLADMEDSVGQVGRVDRRDSTFFGHDKQEDRRSRSGRVLSVTSASGCENVLSALSSDSRVTWVEQHYEKHVQNAFSRYTTQSGYQGSTTPIWNVGLTGEGQVVGVSDTGLDVKSCFFYDSSNAVPYDTVSSSHRKITTYITYEDDQDPTSGHGTHVCGSVLGNAGNAYDGMAYDAKVAFFDIGDSSQALYIPTDFNNDLYQPMRDAGAYIMSGSWGASTAAYNADCYYSDQFMQDFEDSVVLYAAGNDGENGASSIGAPATAKNVIAVGAALASSDSWSAVYYDDSAYDGNKVAYFSSQGPTSAGLLKPDVTAPGYFIASAYSDSSASNGHCYMTWKAGTSMATPTAAGNLALIRQFFTDGYYTNPFNSSEYVAFVPTGSLLKAMLVHSTVEMDYYYDETQNPAVDIPSSRGDYYQGYGQVRLDTILSTDGSFDLAVWGAVDEVNHADKVLSFSLVGDEVTLLFDLDSATSMEFKVTMAYTDPVVGLTDASLSNDIDLTVEHDGTTYYPISGNGAADSTNTVEQIVLSSPTAGSTVTVRLECTQLNSGSQEVSLVVSGLFEMNSGETLSPSVSFAPSVSFDPTLSPTVSFDPTFRPTVNPTLSPTLHQDDGNGDDDSNDQSLYLSVGLGTAAVVAVGAVGLFVCYRKSGVAYTNLKS